MSFLHMSFKQDQRQNQKVSYCSLLFEKILRKYDNKSQIAPALKRVNSSQSNIKKIHCEKSEDNKVLIDLNRKIKINRVSSKDSSKDSESNKQNIHDNGATYSQDSGCSGNRQHSDILKSFQNKNRDSEEGNFLDVNQFMQSENCVNAEQIPKESIQNQRNYHQEVRILIMDEDDLPDLILPNKQPSKCELMQQQKLPENFNILPIIQQQVSNLAEQKPPLQKKSQKQERNPSHHIKTKLSLRILKKKLKKLTIQQVIDDVIKHRRIQLDGFHSKPQKQAVCQALMSFMKNQIIN